MSIFIGVVDASRPVALGVTSIHHLILIEAVGDAEFRHEFGDGCTLNDVIASPTWLDKATCCTAATVCASRYIFVIQFIVRSCIVHCIVPVTKEALRR